MPLADEERIGWHRPSQSLKSPTTLTRRALGAQTAKATAGHAVEGGRVRAELLVGMLMCPLGQEMSVEIA